MLSHKAEFEKPGYSSREISPRSHTSPAAAGVMDAPRADLRVRQPAVLVIAGLRYTRASEFGRGGSEATMKLKRNWIPSLAIGILAATAARAQTLPVKWEELTAADFVKAIAQAQGTCVLPIGVLEKHGPHLPLGNDLLNVRFLGVKSAEAEYAVVFPEYYFGQIFEAKQEAGTVAYSAEL
jgi:hypothetical protein